VKILIISTLLLFISCGRKENEINSDPQVRDYGEQNSVQHFRGILRPINNQLSGFLPTGIAEVKIINDKIEVKTLLDDDAKVIHIQSIHLGNRCPEQIDDKNVDGLIDIEEAHFASGNIYIPLDSDLNSELLGQGNYPMGGGYTYFETASLKAISKDLESRNQTLDFLNRVVLIHGTYSKSDLPGTIETLGIYPVEKSLPIACGVLRKLDWIRPTRWQGR
jgi:hypothetical protein